MLILTALVRSVAQDSIDETNRETGKITKVWKIQVEHTTGKGDLELKTLKAKSQVQADGWRKFLSQEIKVPVETVAYQGNKVALWIIEGQLPSLLNSVQLKAA